MLLDSFASSTIGFAGWSAVPFTGSLLGSLKSTVSSVVGSVLVISNSHSGWPCEMHLVSRAWTVLSRTSAKRPAREPLVNIQLGCSEDACSIASKQLLITTLAFAL